MNIKIPIMIIFFIFIIYIHPSYAIQESNLTWSTGDVYTLTPSSNMATEGIYTIKTIDFPAPARGRLSVNDTIIPDTPVNLAVTIELYKDIINNSNPIATFTIRPGDEYIVSSQDLRITIDSMPASDSSDWVYESYNPSANIRLQQIATPNMDITIDFTDTLGNSINIVNPGDTFLVNVSIQNSGDDVAKTLTYKINPDARLKPTAYTNKLQDTIGQLDVDGQITDQIRLIAPDSLGSTTYEIDVNVTSEDSRNLFHYWNNSGLIEGNGSLNMLTLDKEVEKTTIYLKEEAHVILSIRNRGTLPITNIEIKDPIPDNFNYIQGWDNVELDNLTEVSIKRDSLSAEETWTFDYFLKPLMPGIYVLPAYTANFTMNGIKFSNTSNEIGFRVYGPIIQLNKSVINHGNNTLEIDVSANNIGNGPATVVIDDTLPDGAKLLSGNNHSTIFVNANEMKGFNYTILFSGNVKDIPPVNATYYLGDYKFTTSSSENVIKTAPPPIIGAGENLSENASVPVPTIQEIEKKVVGTIAPEPIPTVENKTQGFYYGGLAIILAIIFLILFFIRFRKK